MTAKSFIKSLQEAAAQAAHPHLDPINAATFQSDHALVLAKAGSLMAYQKYLAAARSTKVQRKGVSLAFERNVQAQARQSYDDVQALCGGALRMMQQVNNTDFWSQSLTQMASTLATSGPVTAKQMWAEVQGVLQNPGDKSSLAQAGLTDDVAAAVTELVSQSDVSLALRDGQVSVETQVAGESGPRSFALVPPGGSPSSVVDLLGGSQFDQVVAAFSGGDPLYLEVVASAAAPTYRPADLFAIGAVAARQRMADHVRKLEDTGLATYQGNGPGFVLGVLISALVVGAIGAGIVYECDQENNPIPPGQVVGDAGFSDTTCNVGSVLLFLAVSALALLAGVLAIVPGVTVAIEVGVGIGLFVFVADIVVEFAKYAAD